MMIGALTKMIDDVRLTPLGAMWAGLLCIDGNTCIEHQVVNPILS